MTCQKTTTLYIGVTNDLERRLIEHKQGENPGFTKRYNLHKLVYFEEFPGIIPAIGREKQLKWWKLEWKDELITSVNPDWEDLSEQVLE